MSFNYAYIYIFSLPFCLRHTYQLLKKNKKKKENFTSFKCVCHNKGFGGYISRKVTHQDVFGNKKQTPPKNGRTSMGLLLSHLRSRKVSSPVWIQLLPITHKTWALSASLLCHPVCQECFHSRWRHGGCSKVESALGSGPLAHLLFYTVEKSFPEAPQENLTSISVTRTG